MLSCKQSSPHTEETQSHNGKWATAMNKWLHPFNQQSRSWKDMSCPHRNVWFDHDEYFVRNWTLKCLNYSIFLNCSLHFFHHNLSMEWPTIQNELWLWDEFLMKILLWCIRFLMNHSLDLNGKNQKRVKLKCPKMIMVVTGRTWWWAVINWRP